MKLSEALEVFLLDHRARGSRPRTLEWHRYTLNYLLKPLLEADADASSLSVFTVSQALAKDLKPNTLFNYERSLRAFCSWLVGWRNCPAIRSKEESGSSRCFSLSAA
ncbi:hypothetical protein HNQ08_000873 [Deinococcus humi]|uniref:Core-binding (CB) domain-containing protein n=1 Tax=Deinococcus humi TaxID=662880 RepID=A0A7W8JTQ7_9DEIO|nr:hypothetical protein [Deinococcus humi]